MSLHRIHNTIREHMSFEKKKHACYFTQQEIEEVLRTIGASATNLPSWWQPTKAGICHPGKDNHEKILEALKANKIPLNKIKSHADASKWALSVIRKTCPRNLNGLRTEETENGWNVIFEITNE